jgi:hypothetical protein
VLVAQGEYILQELEALVKLHKYRTLRKQYNPDREDEMVASEFEKFKEKAGLLPPRGYRALLARFAHRTCGMLCRAVCCRGSIAIGLLARKDSCTDGASTVLFIIHYSLEEDGCS